jgi:ribosomal protein S18 acetylase RimI-like enzyme
MIRELTINDFEMIDTIISNLHKIHTQNRPDFYAPNKHPLSKKEFIQLLKDNNKINLAFVSDNQVVGICLATIKNKISKSIYIDDIFVLKEFRRQGIATKLFNEIESIANKIEAQRIDLTVWQFNTNAIEFYKSLGMSEQRIVLEKRLEL